MLGLLKDTVWLTFARFPYQVPKSASHDQALRARSLSVVLLEGVASDPGSSLFVLTSIQRRSRLAKVVSGIREGKVLVWGSGRTTVL